MAKYSNQDDYLDPDTGVLKNKLGIENEAELEEIEADYAMIRSYELAQQPVKGNFDLNHLKTLHHHLFGDVYDWAGEFRNIDISKGDSYFAKFNYIETAAKAIFDELVEEKYLYGLDPEHFSERIAYYLGEINALHPFRDGNGRAQREFINQLVRKNGYSIDWKNISQEEMLAASIQSFKKNLTPLISLLRKNLRSSDLN